MHIALGAVWCWSWTLAAGSLYHEGSRTLLTPPPEDPADYFGYSVMLRDNPPELVVGAPLGNNPSIAECLQCGEVYSCKLTLDAASQNITCARNNNYYNIADSGSRNYTYSPFIENMCLGATLVEAPNGGLVMCAPKWANEVYEQRRVNGLCYSVTRRQKKETLIPLLDSRRQFFEEEPYFAHGQAGFSASVSSDQSWMLLGAPGLLRWTGGVVQYKLTNDAVNGNGVIFNKQPTVNPTFTDVLKQDSYFGYSVDVGIFEPGHESLGVAGAPRGHDGQGEVLVFSLGSKELEPFNIRAHLLGSQWGEYFGATVLVADLNADGRADLLVSAPQYALPSAEKDCCFDQGAVYVYINKKTEKGFELELRNKLRGSGFSGAKFGYALADLGDVDGDGYSDIAIGAPFEMNGVVYIYRGSAHGVRANYTQRIMPSVMELAGFGFSISRGIDLDKNGCKDLAVGGVMGHGAAVYRCTPTLVVRGSIRVVEALASLGTGMVGIAANATSFTAEFCVRTDKTRNEWAGAFLDINSTMSMDNNRKEFMQLRALPEKNNCKRLKFNLQASPAAIRLNLDIDKVPKEEGSVFDPRRARLGEDSVLRVSLKVYFMACGDDLVCQPDFRVNFTTLSRPPYVPGSNDPLGVLLTLKNEGDPSYGACVKISLGHESAPVRVPSQCTLDKSELSCQLDRPFPRNAEANWTIELEKSSNRTEALQFGYIVYETCEETVARKGNITLPVEPKANITIFGHSKPNSTLSVPRTVLSEDGQIEFAHSFEIFNHGPSDWSDVKIEFKLSPDAELIEQVAGCAQTSPSKLLVICRWPVRVRRPLPYTAILRLRLRIRNHEVYLRSGKSLNVTTQATLAYGKFNSKVTVMTSFTLESAPPIWPIILALIVGLLLIALIIFIMYKTGFFVRSKKQELKMLRKESAEKEAPEVSRRHSTSVSELLEDDYAAAPNTSEPAAAAAGAADITQPSSSHL